ncbi:F-box protein [Apiospora rasikravindrae]|uniref:F-box protein n=1 Tax=Apiospora rasikravindrae TaxID=990691 RepID=A0ABR1TCA8_9PEZI
MARALPNELLFQILKCALPYDFESLALTSKRMYALSRPLLARHNELRSRYRSFRLGQSSTDLQVLATIDPLCVPELLLDIAADPIIARYIVHADLGDRVYVNDAIDDGGRIDDYKIKERLQHPDERDRLRALVNESRHLAMLDLSPNAWFANIVNDEYGLAGEPDYPVAFLLSLLPNLESLALGNEWWDGDRHPRPASLGLEGGLYGDRPSAASDLLHLLVTRANDDGGLEADQDCPLRKLRILRPIYDVDEQYGASLEGIAPFLALNSLREVQYKHGVLDSVARIKGETDLVGIVDQEGKQDGENRDGGQYEKEDEIVAVRLVLPVQVTGRYAVLGPNLEILILDDTVVSAEAAGLLFKDMHHLKVLELYYSMKDEIGWEWDVNRFLANVANGAGQHLERLALTAGVLGPDHARLLLPDNGDLEDLHGFRALTYLELDTKLFIASGADCFIDSSDPDCMPTPVADIAGGSVPSLVDVAPPTVREFVLHVPGTAEDRTVMEALFCDWAERRRDALLDLVRVEVVVHGEDALGGALEDWAEQYEIARFCMANGIQCSRVRCDPEAIKKCEDSGIVFMRKDGGCSPLD